MPYSLIKARKKILDAGTWQSGKVSTRLFPTHQPLGLPSKATWRCAKLAVIGAPSDSPDLRLLIAVQPEKCAFHAMLGQIVGSKVCVLAALEDHPTHPGLHCHAVCDKELPDYLGSVRYPGMMVAPTADSRRRRTFTWSEPKALSEAFRFFEVTDKPEGALL